MTCRFFSFLAVLFGLCLAISVSAEQKSKVFLVGFGKSGTSSFHGLLTQLGYRSAHHQLPDGQFVGALVDKALKEGKPMLYYLSEYDAITQFDVATVGKCFSHQFTHLDQLYRENPEAVFILNVRELKSHVRSIMNWGDLPQRLEQTFLVRDYLGNTTEEKVANWIKTELARTRAFFAAHPEAKFIEFQIETDKPQKLDKYIDTKGLPFPNLNQNPRLH